MPCSVPWIVFTVGTDATPLRDGREWGGGNQSDPGEERSQAGGQGPEGTSAQLLFHEQGGHFAAAGGGGEVKGEPHGTGFRE